MNELEKRIEDLKDKGTYTHHLDFFPYVTLEGINKILEIIDEMRVDFPHVCNCWQGKTQIPLQNKTCETCGYTSIYFTRLHGQCKVLSFRKRWLNKDE